MLSRLFIILMMLVASPSVFSQMRVKGRVLDSVTKEPVHHATIHCSDAGCNCGCQTNTSGEFEMQCRDCKTLAVSFVGYTTKYITTTENNQVIYLSPSSSVMNEVIVTANRGETVKRSQAPVAVTSLSAKTIQETKAISADQLLNKVSGVNMVNLGNEQHQMSIRQPITTRSLFLYLEDGIPVRTSGLFNHNALLEMNMASTRSIEVIKGPSSSLYGSEAIGGVVNFISVAPTVVPVLKTSVQASNMGYKRAEVQSSFLKNKWGFTLSGYYADKRNSFMDYSDFHKAIWTARVDYRFNAKTNITNTATWLNYYSDMPGGVDSTMFRTRKFSNPQTFTFRKVNAFRYRSTLTQSWNDRSKTTVSLIYRENSIAQNPNYRIKDDYRKTGNTWVGKKDLAHGEINESRFNSYSLIAQHKQNFIWKKASLITGFSADLSPSTYQADYIRIKKDTVSKKYLSYQRADSTLTDYATRLNNYAAFVNFELSPASKLRIVASLRYDRFHYSFNNHLTPSAFSGSADTINNFSRISPKVGFTYRLSTKTGLYANYSQGFVPPQVTELYTGVKVPRLSSAVFHNFEIGGWSEVIRNKLSVDISAYRLEGRNEIVSVRLDDGSNENRNTGKTSHQGIEFAVNAQPSKDLSFRISGAYSEHRFTEFVEKGNSYNGNEMNGAPRWIHNAEIWYRPSFVKGLRLGAEWQKVGSYFMDPKNTLKYQGYDVLNLRFGYQYKRFDIWINMLNATDEYYAFLATKSASGHNYQLAEPRSLIAGISYDFGEAFKK